MTMSPIPRWSFDVGQGDWLKERLDDFMDGTVTSIVPTGFEAYARLLHPVETPVHGDRLVRWANVAKWSGVTLTAQAQWLTVAMPEIKSARDRPWRSQGPEDGSLYLDDARALAQVASQFTNTPDQCWCCIWEGFGWLSRIRLLPPGQSERSPLPTPIPMEARNWPKVHTRYRDYFLFEESLKASFMDAIGILEGHSPNLWWPGDHAWCVGTDIDSNSTYVGGSKAFIQAILLSPELEAFEVESTDSTFADMPEWMVEIVARTVDELLSTGRAEIETSIGGIRFEFHQPSHIHSGILRYEYDSQNGRGSGYTSLSGSIEKDMRQQIARQVEGGLRNLAS